MRSRPETLTVDKSFRVHRCPVCKQVSAYETVYAEYRQEGAYVRCVALAPCNHIIEKDDDDAVYR
jgi:hypothetical protein